MSEFLNPYAFIPLLKEGKTKYEKNDDEKLTGYIEYTIKLKNNIFIPNTSNDHVFSNAVKQKIDSCEELSEEQKEQILDKHKSYDFFSYEPLRGEMENVYHEPVIPGSEIRGMIRSIHEALTNSCMSVLDTDKVLTKRTCEQFKPGLLKKNIEGRYELYGAKDYIYRRGGKDDFRLKTHQILKEEKYTDGVKVRFNVIKTKEKGKPKAELDVNGINCGYLIMGEDGPQIEARNPNICNTPNNIKCPHMDEYKNDCEKENKCFKAEKHCVHIFEKKEKMITALKEETIKRNIETVIDIAQNQDEERYVLYKASFLKFIEKSEVDTFFPVYYSEVNFCDKEHRFYFSPACITREVYYNTIGSILEGNDSDGNNGYRPCSSENFVCPSCHLFGTVFSNGTDNEKAIAGKLRFSDARLPIEEQNQYGEYYKKYYDDIRTIPELSEPKLSNTEFYLMRPEVGKDEVLLNWTYDYYIVMKKNLRKLYGKYKKEGYKTETGYYHPILAGRKFYWHSREEKFNEVPNERNRTIRPLKKGTFTGRVYFEKISEKELAQLRFLFRLCENDLYAYKLGSAKPYGYGSIILKENVTKTRTFSLEKAKYKENIESEDIPFDSTGFCKELEQKFYNILNYQAAKHQIIHYPRIEECNIQEEGFRWFGTENNKCYFAKDRNMGVVSKNVTTKTPFSRDQLFINQPLTSLQSNQCCKLKNKLQKNTIF